MLASKLYEEIQKITCANIDNRYQVISLPNLPHKLGSSEDGFPKFFVVSSGNSALIHNLNADLRFAI